MKIKNETWTIQDVNLYGLCEPQSRTISISGGQSDKDRLDTLIHEVLHALDPDPANEQGVGIIANTLSRILWRDGWRRKKS